MNEGASAKLSEGGKVRARNDLHGVADEAEGGRVRTAAFWASAVQQPVEHPSVLAGSVPGATAEEGMRAGGGGWDRPVVVFLKVKVMLRSCPRAHPWNTQVSDSLARLM